MGWDAYAVTSREVFDTGENEANPVLQALFTEASAKVLQKRGWPGQSDGTLAGPSLPFLQLAANLVCIDYNSQEGRLFWSKETVQEANAKADWNFGLDERFKRVYDALYTTPPAYNILDLEDEESFQGDKWEVRVFLEMCAENDLAIMFTW